MTWERLSALDASFLSIEGPSNPMHVGWVARFDAPRKGSTPSFDELFEHIAGRLGQAPRYRQRLAEVPLSFHEPIWVDDQDFDAALHLRHAEGEDLTEVVDTILSSPLERDRPLWEIWIADDLPGKGLALIGKMHHCMVDGMAVAQLGDLLLDSQPDGPAEARPGAEESDAPAPAPSATERLARGLADRALDSAVLALAPARIASSPSLMLALPGAAARGLRMLAHVLLPPAPSSPLNQPGSADRHHVRSTRSVDELRALRRSFDVTPNDVLLAACAGALRRFAQRRGEEPQRLKVMIPADVRRRADAQGGNRISFLFIDLPCDEPDPVVRLESIHLATSQRERDGEAEDLDAAFGVLARTLSPIQRTLAHAFAHPRLFNLTISTMPGPAVPRYLRGCRLREAYSAVPLAGRHALSIGIVTVAGQVCLAIYADSLTLPDADELSSDLDEAFEELLAAQP